MKRIAYFSTQFTTVKSGPGRFAEYLRNNTSSSLRYVFFTDDISPDQASENVIVCTKIGWLSRIPFYWILRAFFFNTAFRAWRDGGHQVDAIMCSSALEAMFLLSSGTKIPVYVMVNDYKYLKSKTRFGEMFRSNKLSKTLSRVVGYYAERHSVSRASIVVANSFYTQKAIVSIYKIPEEKVKVLYKAVDVSYFSYRHRENFPTRKFLFAKNDWRIGGLDLILDAFVQLEWQSEIILTVAGPQESERQSIGQMIRQKGFKGRFELLPLLKRDRLREQFYTHDVYISMPRQEALGVSILEAMATGIPVIASNEGGIPEVLDGGACGIMVERDNVSELVQQLNLIRNDPAILKGKVEQAMVQSKAFSKERMEHNLEQLFGV